MKVSDHFRRALGDCFTCEEPPTQICKWRLNHARGVTSTTVLAESSRLPLWLPFDKRIRNETHCPLAVWQCFIKQPTHCPMAVWQCYIKQPTHCPMAVW